MLKAELFEVVANGENSGVEFKRDVEVLPVAGTSLSTLDKSRLAYYLQDIIKDPRLNLNAMELARRQIEDGNIHDVLKQFIMGPRLRKRNAAQRALWGTLEFGKKCTLTIK